MDMTALPAPVLVEFLGAMVPGEAAGAHAPLSLKVVLGEIKDKAERKARKNGKRDRGVFTAAGEGKQAKVSKFARGVHTGHEYYAPTL